MFINEKLAFLHLLLIAVTCIVLCVLFLRNAVNYLLTGFDFPKLLSSFT